MTTTLLRLVLLLVVGILVVGTLVHVAVVVKIGQQPTSERVSRKLANRVYPPTKLHEAEFGRFGGNPKPGPTRRTAAFYNGKSFSYTTNPTTNSYSYSYDVTPIISDPPCIPTMPTTSAALGKVAYKTGTALKSLHPEISGLRCQERRKYVDTCCLRPRFRGDLRRFAGLLARSLSDIYARSAFPAS